MGGGFVWGEFGHPQFWAKIKVGHFKKDDFLKQKRQKNKKS